MKNLFYLFALILATTLLSCSDDMEQDNSKTTADNRGTICYEPLDKSVNCYI